MDTSAIVAMMFNEPEARAMAMAIAKDPIRAISGVSVLEASIVVAARTGPDGMDDLDLLLAKLQCDVRPFAAGDLSQARGAFLRFGKGRHPAALNFGDCFSYCLAAVLGEPLLFKGNDFSLTDISAVNY